MYITSPAEQILPMRPELRRVWAVDVDSFKLEALHDALVFLSPESYNR